jgi:hypothetical protein
MIEEDYETYREILLEKPYAAADGMKLLLGSSLNRTRRQGALTLHH